MEVRTFQLMGYYGIFFNDADTNSVYDVVRRINKLAPLTTEMAEVTLPGNVVLLSDFNSDCDDLVELGFIHVDAMTLVGDAASSPERLHFSINPVEMLQVENTNQLAVTLLADIYKQIQAGLAKKGLSRDKVSMGWRIIVCTWAD